MSLPLSLSDFRVIKVATLSSVISLPSPFVTASLRVTVTSAFGATPVAELAGSKTAVGSSTSAILKVASLPSIWLPAASLTVDPMTTYTLCSLVKLLVGSTVITVSSPLATVASNSISASLEASSRTMRASTFSSVSSAPPSTMKTTSPKDSVMLVS